MHTQNFDGKPFGKQREKWVDKIKIGHNESGCEVGR
jgi:hypothetical protein